MGRRVVRLFLAVVVLLSLGVGCVPTLGPRKPTVINVVVITWPGGGAPPAVLSLYKAALEVTKAKGEEFELKVSLVSPTMPDQKSAPQSTPPTVTALEQALGQSPPPDVVLFSSWYEFAAAVERDLVAPLDDLTRSDPTFKAEDYYPGTLEAVTDQGRLYGLPLSALPVVMMYDQRLFDAAGLSAPDSTWNWSTLLSAAKRLTKPDAEGGPQWGLSPLQANWLPALIWQNGGEFVSKDGRRSLLAEPAALEAIKFYSDLIHTHEVAAKLPNKGDPRGQPAIARAMPVGPGEYPPIYSPGGRVAMQVMSGSAFAYGFPFGRFGAAGERPIKIAELPGGKQQATLVELQTALAVTNASPNQKAAFKALNALATEMRKDMIVPATRADAKQLARTNPSLQEEDAKVLLAAMEHGRSLPLFRQSRYMQVFYQKLLSPIQSGEKEPADAAREAAEAIDELLNKETLEEPSAAPTAAPASVK